MNSQSKIKVLIVDDSASVRQAMAAIIAEDPDLEVLATANDPLEAAEKIRRAVPDVITLDVEMPRMDGVTFLRRLMSQHPIPVVMCSSLVEENSETLHAALESGAVEIICKPKLGVAHYLAEQKVQIVDAIKAASKARIRRTGSSARRPVGAKPPEKKLSPDEVLAPPNPSRTAMLKTTEMVVAIGASTGGTEALRHVLSALPPDSPPIVIVQHMPENFTSSFAKRLDEMCQISVREARSGDSLLRGQALIAPGGRHTLVARSGARYTVEVREGPLVSRHRPSVDVLFRSVARAAGRNSVGIIMTGMGDDGAKGLGEMRAAGARTFGQDEKTCVVYGMPQMAKKAGSVEMELPLEKIAAAMLQVTKV